MSADGKVVVGHSSSSAGQRAFRWTAAGGLQSLGVLDGYSLLSSAAAVSADGSTVVGTCTGVGGGTRGFRWTASGGLQALAPLEGSVNSTATSISADGRVCGGLSSDQGVSSSTGVCWNEAGVATRVHNQMAVVSALSDNGLVAGGEAFAGGYSVALRWDAEGGLIDLGRLPGADSAEIHAIGGDGGVVVGHSGDQFNEIFYLAFRWTAERGMESLGHLPGQPISAALDVTPCGSVVVGRSDREPDTRAFFWTNGRGMMDLGEHLRLNGVEMSDWTLIAATGISADGRCIVGYGDLRGEVHPFMVRGLALESAEFNDDGSLDLFDYLDFLGAYASGSAEADFNGDGGVDLFDYLDFVDALVAGC